MANFAKKVNNMQVKIEPSWALLLKEEFEQPYFASLVEFVKEAYHNHTVYPPGSLIFNAYNHTPVASVRVVILGQDPYHQPNQAHGLCFSVPNGVPHPPSLRNIFREIENDLGLPVPRSGNLERWANQGVLLLNATLTVEAGKAGSHQKRGWETFTDRTIAQLSESAQNVVFMLWGNYARQKRQLIDAQKHLILESVHPSPLSAHAGFFGNKHFSKANDYLSAHNRGTIEW